MAYQWQLALQKSLKRNRREAHNRYLQLATIGLDGFPANRTVVFRGFGENGELLIVTDRRNDKFAQVENDPRVEVSWYFTRSREQYRLRGQLALVDAQGAHAPARMAAWNKLSEAAREQFFWPHPGAPVGDDTNLTTSAEPPAHFLLGMLTVQRVDHLRLAGSPQQRMISQMDGEAWLSTAVNP
ncbi:MAG: pyridoxamine 5'-phosphate oxidase family protein [Pseudomonadota bacterium]